MICHGWEKSKRDAFFRAFEKRGIASLYSKDIEDKLAKISLTVGLGSTIDDAAKAIDIGREELKDLILHINEISKRASGFAPFVFAGQIIRSRI